MDCFWLAKLNPTNSLQERRAPLFPRLHERLSSAERTLISARSKAAARQTRRRSRSRWRPQYTNGVAVKFRTIIILTKVEAHTGAGKSVIIADLLAQIGHRFGFRLIVEEGLSHAVLTQTQGCEPVIVNPNGYYAIAKVYEPQIFG
jgi:hypothetical protein